MTRSYAASVHRSRATLGLAALVAGSVLVGCASGASTSAGAGAAGSGSSTATSGPAAVDGGTLTLAVNTDATCPLDPHQSPASLSGLLARPVLDSLVSAGTDGSIKPWLATAWTVSDDQKTYTFTLRDDVTFSDGTKFDGAAVKANLDQIVAPQTKSQYAAGLLGAYASTDVIDATHVAIQLKTPDSTLLTSLSTPSLGIESPQSLQGSLSTLCTEVVGSGPFTTDGYTPAKGVHYTKNPDYAWGPATAAHAGAAHLDGITVQIISEDSSRLGALTSGQVDAVTDVPPVNVAQLKSADDLQVLTNQAPGAVYSYYPNVSRGPFADIKVRTAFREGIDWSTLVSTLFFGVYQPATGPLSPTTYGYDKQSSAAYRYDQAGANKLLDEAGWTTRDSDGYRTKDGQRLTLTHPFLAARATAQNATLSVQIQAAAKQLGIEVINSNVDYSSYLKAFVSNDYDLFDFSWSGISPNVLQTLFAAKNISKDGAFATNASRLSDPELDAQLTAALETTDRTKQLAAYASAQQIIADQAAVFPVYVSDAIIGANKSVQGLSFSPDGQLSFYDAWKQQ